MSYRPRLFGFLVVTVDVVVVVAISFAYVVAFGGVASEPPMCQVNMIVCCTGRESPITQLSCDAAGEDNIDWINFVPSFRCRP